MSRSACRPLDPVALEDGEHLVEEPGHPHRTDLGGAVGVDPLRASPARVLCGVGEAVQPDLGDPVAGEAELDEVAHRGAVAGTVDPRPDVVVGVEGEQPPAGAEVAAGESGERRPGQRVVAADDRNHRGAPCRRGDRGLQARVRRPRVGVAGVALDVAEVDDPELLEVDAVVAVVGAEAGERGAEGGGGELRLRGADRRPRQRRAEHREVARVRIAAARGEPVARGHGAPSAGAAIGIRTPCSAAAVHASA